MHLLNIPNKYHGTDPAVLEIAVGHIEGSSLPVGGKGTHCVISGHRGLPSAKLFTDIDQLKEGDTFQLQVLNRTLSYEVDQIRIVLPDQLEDLAIDPDKDYCTLVTCTPYGVNTHRLLVRGHRIRLYGQCGRCPDGAALCGSVYRAANAAADRTLDSFLFGAPSSHGEEEKSWQMSEADSVHQSG